MNIQAVVLNVRDHREHDRIITCYSRELGKIEILVRSARKLPSKLAPLTSGLYALLNLVIEPGKNNYHLLGGETKKYYQKIFSDYKKITLTNQLLKITNKSIKTGKPNRVIYDLIIKTIEKIDKADVKGAKIFLPAFIIKFLSLLGYRPEIKKCLDCHKTIRAEDVYFSLSRGGIVCQKCPKAVSAHGHSLKVSLKTLCLLQDLLYRDFAFLEKLVFREEDLKEAQKVIEKFLEWQIT